MSNRSTPVLWRALLELWGAHSTKALRGSTRGAKLRNLSAFDILATRRTSLPLCPAPSVSIPSRSFINLAVPISSRRMEYTECRTLRYSPEQIFSIVADVDQYQHFVPWCKKSRVTRGNKGDMWADLDIGFPPVVERYTSEVTVIPNVQVRAVCTDGSLFSHLETVWRFAPGTKGQSDSCKVNFYVSFEFKSFLHSQLAGVFFDEVVKQMVRAFELRAAALYGDQQRVPLRRRST